jgi:hypothetical protein
MKARGKYCNSPSVLYAWDGPSIVVPPHAIHLHVILILSNHEQDEPTEGRLSICLQVSGG